MGEHTEREERKFDPTPRRIDEARRQGRVAQSRDLNGSVQLAVGLIVAATVGPWWVRRTASAVARLLERVGEAPGGTPRWGDAVALALRGMLLPALALCAALGVGAVAASMLQTRLLFAPEAVLPRWENVDPLRRARDLFAPSKLGVRLAIVVARLLLPAAALWLVLAHFMPLLAATSRGSLASLLAALGRVGGVEWGVAAALFVAVALADYAWQRHQWWSNLKMTYEEYKRERIEQEGQPEVKQRRRRMHRELTLNQVIEAVPKATVVVTNPTHIAVALRYRSGIDRAPVVVAKGVDAMALQIRSIARRHGVPIVEHRPLARTLWRTVRVGRPISSNLYRAVAEVLARVYRARAGRDPATGAVSESVEGRRP